MTRETVLTSQDGVRFRRRHASKVALVPGSDVSHTSLSNPVARRPVLSRPWVTAVVTVVLVSMSNAGAAALRPLERDIAKTPSVMLAYLLLMVVGHLICRLYSVQEGPGAGSPGRYWSVFSPLIRTPGPRMAFMAVATALFLFLASVYAP
jgi:hypothetical protein